MAVPKEINCIHCKKALPFGQGFIHDDDLNFICSHCKKPLFGVTEQAEEEVRKASPASTSLVMGFQTNWPRKEPLPIRITNDVEEEEATPEDDGYACFC